MIRILALSLAWIIFGNTASAQDIFTPRWSGFYAGGHIGYGWGTAGIAVPRFAGTTPGCLFTAMGIPGVPSGSSIPVVEAPPGSEFTSSMTGNQSYPASVAQTLGLNDIGGGFFEAVTPVAFDFRDSGAPVATDECTAHRVYVLGPDGRYYGGARSSTGPVFPPNPPGFPVDFIPQDTGGEIVEIDSNAVSPSDLGPFAGIDLDAATQSALRAVSGSTIEISMRGPVGGIHAGWNWLRWQHLLLGLETDFTLSNIDGSRQFGSASVETAVDWFATARGRIGTVHENWLIYLTGGLAFGNTSVTYSAGGVTVTDAERRTGWTAGGGLEVAIDPDWTVKSEYKYLDFGTASYPAGTAFDVRGDFDLHTVIIGFNRRF